MRKLLFPLLAAIILLVAADRIAVAVAERKVSDRVASAYGLPGTPLRFTVPPGALPLHLRISSVRVSPAGLHIPATGRDVHFATDG